MSDSPVPLLELRGASRTFGRHGWLGQGREVTAVRAAHLVLPEDRPVAIAIAGLVLVAGGIGIYWLTGELILNPEGEFPWFVRIGLPLVVGGVTILLVIALLQRLKAAKHDKYTDVVD